MNSKKLELYETVKVSECDMHTYRMPGKLRKFASNEYGTGWVRPLCADELERIVTTISSDIAQAVLVHPISKSVLPSNAQSGCIVAVPTNIAWVGINLIMAMTEYVMYISDKNKYCIKTVKTTASFRPDGIYKYITTSDFKMLLKLYKSRGCTTAQKILDSLK